jgi:hypothetical protein
MLINNGDYDLTPDNTSIFSYPNDILDGVYLDGDETYAFISAHMDGYPDLLDALDREGVGYVNFETVDDGEEPHCYVIEALGRLMVADLENMLEDF